MSNLVTDCGIVPKSKIQPFPVCYVLEPQVEDH